MTGLRFHLVSLMLIGTLTIGVMPAVAEVQATNTFEPYVTVNDYSWTETDFDGSRLLKETGTLYGVGLVYTHIFESRLTLKPAVEIFGGDVDYDGATQAGVPVKSTSKYWGFKLRTDVGQQVPLGQSFVIEPFAGLALWVWSRTVEDSVTVQGTPAFGYTEDWTSLFARLGLRGTAALSSSASWFVEGGAKLPLYNENYAHIGSGITLNPGREVAFFAETGFKIHAFSLSVSYDGQRYSVSDVSDGFVQPESKADQYGVKAGWTF